MTTVIYSASPLWAFLNTFANFGYLLVMGLLAVGYGLFREQQRRNRIITTAVGLFLVIASLMLTAFPLATLIGGDVKTVTAQINDKQIAVDNCGTGRTCARPVISMLSQGVLYDFSLPQAPYDAMQPETCYRVSYFPNTNLLAMPPSSESYVATSYVTRIEQIDASACRS